MDDEKIGAQGLQQFISLLREMNEETRIAIDDQLTSGWRALEEQLKIASG